MGTKWVPEKQAIFSQNKQFPLLHICAGKFAVEVGTDTTHRLDLCRVDLQGRPRGKCVLCYHVTIQCYCYWKKLLFFSSCCLLLTIFLEMSPQKVRRNYLGTKSTFKAAQGLTPSQFWSKNAINEVIFPKYFDFGTYANVVSFLSWFSRETWISFRWYITVK